jgi:ribosomal protein S18 acetylase RimI-like enzyme
VPLSADVAAALELGRKAIVAATLRSGPALDAEPRIASVAEKIRAGTAEGRLYCLKGEPSGIALWDIGHPAGVTIQYLFLTERARSTVAYRDFQERIAQEVGPFVFSPGGLAGLSDEEEATLMRARGFESFARSEMRLPPGANLPAVIRPPGVQIRAVRADDEPAVVALHVAAFRGHFDRFMFLTDPNPEIDAARAVREMMAGHYGEFLPWASSYADSDDRPLGASLVVRASYGPLLISVTVDPTSQGRGLGRALVLTNLHALRDRGETVAVLNVTEGNARAVRLYEDLGFVRTIGPEHAWYLREAVPAAPGEAPTPSPRTSSPDTKGSSTPRTPRT